MSDLKLVPAAPTPDATLDELLGVAKRRGPERGARYRKRHAWDLLATDPSLTPAERVIAKFGGPRRLAAAIGYDPSQVYRWTYKKDARGNGLNGRIPPDACPLIFAAAGRLGIDLDLRDIGMRAA